MRVFFLPFDLLKSNGLKNVLLFRVTPCITYTQCNSRKITHFLHCIFLKDLMVEKNIIKCYYFPSDSLINTTIFFSLPIFIAFSLLKGTPHTTIFKNLQNTNSSTEEHFAIAKVGVLAKKQLQGMLEICQVGTICKSSILEQFSYRT